MFDAAAIREIAKGDAIHAANAHLACETTRSLIVPDDFKVVSYEHAMPLRNRPRGNMKTSAIGDFVAYAVVNAEEGAGVFIDPDSLRAVAVLNLGTPIAPGHADNTATLVLDQTAAYQSLMQHASGNPLSQKSVAEFFEDWQDHMSFKDQDGNSITPPKAVAAIRKISIEAAKKVESEEQSLSATKSAFESVKATSTEAIPTHITFSCMPFYGLQGRTFVMRLSVLTGGAAPAFALRIIKFEQHRQDMAAELVSVVEERVVEVIEQASCGKLSVMIGTYTTGR